MFIGIYPVFNELTFSMLNRIIPSIFIVTTANLSNPRGMGPAWGTPDNQGFIHTLGPVLHVKLCRAAVQCKNGHLVDKGRNNRVIEYQVGVRMTQWTLSVLPTTVTWVQLNETPSLA